ncbi:MAG: 16S rRNA (adenine(1518)-N(6)/adenine(1519)-N(6))-dimethyltransferase RsmA [Oscillospiraceae bacterium]
MADTKNSAGSTLAKNGLSPKKLFGQNFLVNVGICEKIAEQSVCGDELGIIEIGPGMGALTKELAIRAKKVVAIEIDSDLIPVLEENLREFDNVEVINCDILKIDLKKVIVEHFQGMRVGVVGNLPYYITSPIIMMLLEQRLPIEFIVAMVQKEAAQRFCASEASRECGAVTLAIRYYSEPQMLFDVAAGSFYPPPNVTSSVIRLEVRASDVKPADEARMFAVIKAAFSQRRKTAANSISSVLAVEKASVIRSIESLGLDPSIRPERMTIQNFSDLSALI